MKKIAVFLLTMAIIIGIYVPCFADEGAPSPITPEDVVIVDDKPGTEPTIIINPEKTDDEPIEYEVEIEVHSFLYKDEIKDEFAKQQLEEAYRQISTIDNISNLVPDKIEEISHKYGAETKDLVVRDLFDVSAYIGDGEQIDQNGTYSFTLHAQNLDNFICLLVYHNDEWHVVENVEVLKDEELLKVETDELSPFAIVVATKYDYNNEIPSGCTNHYFIMFTTIITFVLTQIIRRKDSNTKQIIRRNVLIRDILCLISLLVSVIFYIFNNCEYDIYALIAEIIVVAIAFIYSHPFSKDKNDK